MKLRMDGKKAREGSSAVSGSAAFGSRADQRHGIRINLRMDEGKTSDQDGRGERKKGGMRASAVSGSAALRRGCRPAASPTQSCAAGGDQTHAHETLPERGRHEVPQGYRSPVLC